MSTFLKRLFGLLVPVAIAASVTFIAPALAVDKKAADIVINDTDKNILQLDAIGKLPAAQDASKSTAQENGQADYSIRIDYRCSNNHELILHYIAKGDEEFVLLKTDGEISVRLERTQSGSGALYSDDVREWHTKANQGLLIKKDKTLKCFEKKTNQLLNSD